MDIEERLAYKIQLHGEKERIDLVMAVKKLTLLDFYLKL